MWTSLLYHIRNVHEWSDTKCSYTSCTHGPLTARQTVAKRWLTGSSAVYASLQNIVLDGRSMKDLANIVKFKHIEVYHKLLCKYYPKRLSFFYKGMNLDHNSSMNRKQAVTKKKELKNKIQYSKTGRWTGAVDCQKKNGVKISRIHHGNKRRNSKSHFRCSWIEW